MIVKTFIAFKKIIYFSILFLVANVLLFSLFINILRTLNIPLSCAFNSECTSNELYLVLMFEMVLFFLWFPIIPFSPEIDFYNSHYSAGLCRPGALLRCVGKVPAVAITLNCLLYGSLLYAAEWLQNRKK